MKPWLIVGLLVAGILQAVPKHADKTQTNQGDRKSLSDKAPKPATGGTENVVSSGPSLKKEENGTNSKVNQSDWREKLISPLISNWPLVAVAIWGTIIAIRTLNTIKEQTQATRIAAEATEKSVRLQEVNLRQWVTIENWCSVGVWIPEGGALSLHVQFDVVNPTNLPLTLDSVFIMFACHGGTDQGSKIGRKNLVPPGKGHPVVTSIKITEEQSLKWEDLKELVFFVNGYIEFEDVLKEVRNQPFNGLIGCSKKGGVRFIPPYGAGLYIPDQKKNDKNPN